MHGYGENILPPHGKSKIFITELLRPWKLFSLIIGLLLLVYGSFYYDALDWDVPISFIMAICTYLTSAWSLRVIVERRWKFFPAMLLVTWFSVDGCYWLYWHYKNPRALELMRDANFFASLSLYFICGLIWYYRGSLRDFVNDIKTLFIP